MGTYVSTGKITTLSHEALDHTMKLGASVAESILTCAKLKEVLCSDGCYIVIEVEIDTTPFLDFDTR